MPRKRPGHASRRPARGTPRLRAAAVDAADAPAAALVWDNHVCLPPVPDGRWMRQLLRHRRAGANVVSLNVGDAGASFESVQLMLVFYRRWIADHPEDFFLVERVSELRQAGDGRRLGVFFDLEGAWSLEDRIERVRVYYDLGIRWMSLAYNLNNRVAGGCHDDDQGLTPFGRQVVAEMDRVGMVKCCSHTGYRSAREVLESTAKPTLFSHSNPRALCDHPRNIPDDLILACARTGGVVGINGVSLFLGGRADVRRLVDHIEYVAERAGIEHVGLGLDHVYDPEGLAVDLAADSRHWPAEWGYAGQVRTLGPECLPSIRPEMLRRGFSREDTEKVLGLNLLRVAEQVWS